MEYFPDIERYNMNSVDGRALYLAHCELDPIQALIEHTRIALNSANTYFSSKVEHASESGDWGAVSNAMNLQTIFANHISSLNYEAILLILVSRLEESMNIWCQGVYLDNKLIPELKKYEAVRANGALDKAISYLNEYAGINSIKNDRDWEMISAIRDVRNMIVHNGGRVKEKFREKLEKQGIGIRKEDDSVYIDYDTLRNMYGKIIEFCDRVYNIRGLAFSDVL